MTNCQFVSSCQKLTVSTQEETRVCTYICTCKRTSNSCTHTIHFLSLIYLSCFHEMNAGCKPFHNDTKNSEFLRDYLAFGRLYMPSLPWYICKFLLKYTTSELYNFNVKSPLDLNGDNTNEVFKYATLLSFLQLT